MHGSPCRCDTLVPLVEVAWADREVSHAERALILEAAEQSGIRAGGDARALLVQAFQELVDSGESFVGQVVEGLPQLLDRIEDMPLPLQGRLASALKSGQYTPLGAAQPLELDRQVALVGALHSQKLVLEALIIGVLRQLVQTIEVFGPAAADPAGDGRRLSRYLGVRKQ